MPIDVCENCGGQYSWKWEEAFEKFGFNDSDGQVETNQVATVLIEAGYNVEVSGWGVHNTVIISIKKNNKELILHDSPDFMFGYDDPREYLPEEIVEMLDENL